MDPTEHVQEHLQHTVAHGDHDDHGGGEHGGHGDHGHGHSSRWITAAALTAAILAAFAAVTGALTNSHLTDSLHRRIDANDKWNYFQADKIKSSNIDTRIYIAGLMKQPPSKKDIAKKAEYDEGLKKLQTDAEKLTVISNQHVEIHETYETAETMFHISIAIVAIAVVAKRRAFWYVSMVTGFAGLLFFGKGYKHPVDAEPAEAETTASAPAVPGGEVKAAEHASTKAAEHTSTAASRPETAAPAEEAH